MIPLRPARRSLSGAGVLLAVLTLQGCATSFFVPPTGPGEPAADGVARWAALTTSCRGLRAYHAQLHLSGRVAGRGFPTLAAGVAVTRAGAIAFEARLSGPVFLLGGTRDQATLLLTRDRRSVTGPAAALVEALSGVALGPDRLLAVLSGCVAADPVAISASAFDGGAVTRIELRSGDVAFLGREAGHDVVRAGAFDQVRVTYGRLLASGYPQRIDLRTAPGREPEVSLSLRVDSATVDPVLPASIFDVAVPAGTQPMSLEDLRASGPLGDTRRANPLPSS